MGRHSGSSPLERDFGCAVGGAVINEEDFPAAGLGSEVVDCFGEHDGETGAFVEGGDDDGDEEGGFGGWGEDVWEGTWGGDGARGKDGAVELFIGCFGAWGVCDEEDEEVELGEVS